MASANKATILDQLQETATRIKQYILQQIADLSEAVMAAIPETYAGSAEAGGVANKTMSIPMGHLDSTSTATVMTAQVDGITELRDGVCVWLTNGVITSASGFTLNINGLGAKPCYSSLAAASRATTVFNVGYTFLFVYNSTRVTGGCWDIVYGYDTNTTYTLAKLGQGYAVCSTATETAIKTASISNYALKEGGIVTIKFSNDVSGDASLNISTKGTIPIHYQGAAITAGVIKAGDTVTMIYRTFYHVLSIDRWGTDLGSKYEKPSGGIPKTDLASDVQTSLGKADTALQDSSLKTINGESLVGSGDITIGGGGGGSKIVWYTDRSYTNAYIDQACTETVAEHYGYDYDSIFYDVILPAASIQLYRYLDRSQGALVNIVSVDFDRIDESFYLYFFKPGSNWGTNLWSFVVLS